MAVGLCWLAVAAAVYDPTGFTGALEILRIPVIDYLDVLVLALLFAAFVRLPILARGMRAVSRAG